MEAPPPIPGHILAVPFPIPGHVSPMLQLCKLLASHGAIITIVNSEGNYCSVMQSFLQQTQQQEQPCLDIRVVSIRDGSLQNFKTADFPTFKQSVRARENMKQPFVQLIEQLARDASPPFSCFLSDGHLGWIQDIANKFGFPRVALWTSSASELATFFQASSLVSTRSLPFTADDIASQSRRTHDVPRVSPLHREDFPSLLGFTDSNDKLFKYFIEQIERIPEADCVLVNSFYDLESKVFDSLKERVSNILPIGPLAFMSEPACTDFQTYSGFRSDEEMCLQWLDKQKASSVLYISLGSIATLPAAQLLGFALGLESSKIPYLWAIGPELIKGGRHTLPKGYFDRIKDRALVVTSAPQLRVLSHRAVGGFLTYCDWNSILESICMAVPMLCWPMGADQILTCKFLVDEWGLGLSFETSNNGLASAEEVERKVKMLIAEEKGAELRKTATDQSEALKRAVRMGGSSFVNFQYFIQKS